MNGTMTITEAKQVFSTLPEKLSKRKRALAVTRGGKKVLAVMTWEQYEALFGTETVKGRKSKKVRPWTEEEWREKEREVDEDIKAGLKGPTFNSADEAIAYLNQQAKTRKRK